MSISAYIVTNFAYGTGPYLRTTDLAIAVNDELEQRGHARFGIIVPWVYGERQKRVMLEEFATHEKNHPGEIVLDAALGALLRSVFYANTTYEQALSKWVDSYKQVSDIAHRHLSGMIDVETLSGEKLQINGKDIVMELSRSPRVRFDVAPAYFTSFAYVGEILERTRGIKEIDVPLDLLKKGIEAANWVEKDQRMRAIAWPATFAYLGEHTPRYRGEILVPPIAPPPKPNDDAIDQGVFVTITGIPGLERLYADAKRLGLKLYSNDTHTVAGSTRALPHIIPNKNMALQFARAGWSSIWISMISGTPLVVPDFDAKDDPEIYFNNRSVEELDLGVVFRGQSLEDILKKTPRIKESYRKMREAILTRWGTLDGNQYCAKLFADDFYR